MRVGGERDHGRSWRTGVAVGEGVRSALAGRWLSALLVLLVCWVGASSGALDAVTVARLVADEQRFLDAGGSVVIVENHEAGVPAAGSSSWLMSTACTGLPPSHTWESQLR